MADTALVTGCAGFIGSHLTDFLLEKGYTVIGVDNLRTGVSENLINALTHSNFLFIEADICNNNLESFFHEDIDVVFHLAAISSVKLSFEDPKAVHHANVTGTLNVLELAKNRGAKRIVFTSSAAVYGDPSKLPATEDTPVQALSPYAASKIGAEGYVAAFGAAYELETVVLRFFNIYGPRQQHSEYSGVISIFANQAISGQPITVDGDGSHTRSFVFVDDVVRATYLAATVPGAAQTILNISNTEAISVIEIAKMIAKEIGIPESRIIHREARLGDIKDSMGDMEKAQRILGFSTDVSFEEGLRRTLQWYRDNS
ncbi:MAG: SDR family NAD(P)-dependent oxidoreductase [Candidatus Thorarchaeota archaeon]|jgi:UDP-glucose 4-epimerase